MSIRAILARSTPDTRFVRGVTDTSRMEGQRVTLERGGPEVATIVRAWVDEDGNVCGDIECDSADLEQRFFGGSENRLNYTIMGDAE